MRFASPSEDAAVAVIAETVHTLAIPLRSAALQQLPRLLHALVAFLLQVFHLRHLLLKLLQQSFDTRRIVTDDGHGDGYAA